MSLATYGLSLDAALTDSPYIPGVDPELGRRRQQHVERRQRHVCAQRRAPVQRQADQDRRRAWPEVRRLAGAAAEAAELPEQRGRPASSTRRRGARARRATPSATSSTGRPTQFLEGTSSPDGEFRMWNFDFFAQDSWKLRSNLTFEYGVRGGYWTNNAELNDLGGWFDPSIYDPTQAAVPGSGDVPDAQRRALRRPWRWRRRAFSTTAARSSMPRANLAWDIDGQGNNVLRGGYGMFFNRNMGNVEYDNTLRLPPYIYALNADVYNGSSYGGGIGLTYDTVDEVTLAEPARIERHQHADARLVQVPADAQLQRVVCAADLLQPGGGSRLRRHARPPAGEPRRVERGAGRRAAPGHGRQRRTCRIPVNRVAARCDCGQPVPAVPGVSEHHPVRLRGHVELQLDAARR